ncbi:L-threonine 3-dehydrogenase [Anaerohalosphaera lusitana]|uniref:L-threonine 3-dehydrogenase n=1 Tax=Anaerohalosphaera lusitana TaxID=1936003 RepID=A0A1U9NMW9_9BACT|nr:alcohol dehydrogenase catalytic domain-containing protein [Anaerohalosphaera lusitana]AQT69249.1 L-threonine 3-dehydrogenase [Anaerohalosphaera lusitana]
MSCEIPDKQRAVLLEGPDELKFVIDKDVPDVGPFQILCKVEAVGLCFSDLKLLKQFDNHARKSEIRAGIDEDALKSIPSYVPGSEPTVPGHELVVRICKKGDEVKTVELDGRYLVQTDYRWLKTAQSNAALGYNFEGGLQEYVLMDERVITSPEGQSMLIPASPEKSASAIALVEPWACVEDAYAVHERTGIKEGGKMLVVADEAIDCSVLKSLFARFGKPAKIDWVGPECEFDSIGVEIEALAGMDHAGVEAYDDVIYYGSSPETAEGLFEKVAAAGLLNIVQCGGRFGRKITLPVGRTHYGGIRIIGTTGDDPAESMTVIPEIGEIRKGDKINVVGAGGPMGVMHVIRNICQGVPEVEVYASDLDRSRLESLEKLAGPMAEDNGVGYAHFCPDDELARTEFDYTSIMAPVPALVEAAVKNSAQNGIINIFAGIPATVMGQIDLDVYIAKGLYFIGTSGSTIDDMKTVLSKVESGSLDTDVSVAAIAGLEAAIEGIRAVENRSIAGKILVYPQCKGLEMIKLKDLATKLPRVAEALENGVWTRQAEKALIEEMGS